LVINHSVDVFFSSIARLGTTGPQGN